MSPRKGQFSLMARLRGLTLMSVLAMLGIAWGLIWTGYQQRVADRQAAIRQAVEVAHARVQLAYAQQLLGKLDVAAAQKQALAALDKLGQDASDYLWVNDRQLKLLRSPTKVAQHLAQDVTPYVKGFEPWGWMIGTVIYLDDLQSSLMTESMLTLAASMLLGLTLWGLLEWIGRDLKRSPAPAVSRSSLSTMVGQPPARHISATAAVTAAPEQDAPESSTQEVSRLRMAGAI